MLCMLLIHMFFGALIEHRQPMFGHETAFVIIISLAISGIYYLINKDFEIIDTLKFDKNIFFLFLIPLIIFASGYNMRRKKFFSNFGYISIFGILGTVVTFFVYFGLTYAVVSSGWITLYEPLGG